MVHPSRLNCQKSLKEDERQDEILELRGIRRTTDSTGGVPEPLLKCGNIKVLVGVSRESNGCDILRFSLLFTRLSLADLAGVAMAANTCK
jgi:hypothetical protein